jgi:periplasmic protein CpxP/Spy
MKKVVILMAFMFALVANTFAQNDAVAAPLKSEISSKSERKAKMKMAGKELGLTADQKAKMKEVGQSLKGKMMAIKSDATLTKDQKKTQIGEVAKSHETEIKAILSPEQFTKWEAMKKERRGQMKGKGGKKGKTKSDGDGQKD